MGRTGVGPKRMTGQRLTRSVKHRVRRRLVRGHPNRGGIRFPRMFSPSTSSQSYRSYSGLVVLLLAGLVGEASIMVTANFRPLSSTNKNRSSSLRQKAEQSHKLGKEGGGQQAVNSRRRNGARVIVNGNAPGRLACIDNIAHEFKSHVRFSLEGYAEHSRLFETDEARVADA